ncbi:unnamed protein product [Rangifer tarandus platyrhynchus]|uniref:Peptidase S1 domain-containing protein n=2 Tax=Rangifer tarandus platyrhynchus TaxID=3082113 RepID=A0ABN8Y8K1_RANTA|nr:unnamed protein product [Rangifer tarandus platyrhynchus]
MFSPDGAQLQPLQEGRPWKTDPRKREEEDGCRARFPFTLGHAAGVSPLLEEAKRLFDELWPGVHLWHLPGFLVLVAVEGGDEHQLKEKASLTLAMGTFPLPPQFTFIRPGRMCWVAGWGKTDVKEPTSSTLQEMKLRIVEPQACSHFPAFDHSLQLCVGHPQSTKSAFKGDSGGPLLCAGVAQGIVSYGQSNAKPLPSSPGSPITGPGSTRS